MRLPRPTVSAIALGTFVGAVVGRVARRRGRGRGAQPPLRRRTGPHPAALRAPIEEAHPGVAPRPATTAAPSSAAPHATAEPAGAPATARAGAAPRVAVRREPFRGMPPQRPTSGELPAPPPAAPVRRRWWQAPGDALLGRRGRLMQVLLWTVLALVVLRLVAPAAATALINAQLARGESVRGAVDGVSLHVLRGAYDVHGVHLNQRRHGSQEPLLDAERVRIRIGWRRGLGLASAVEVDRPLLHVVELPEDRPRAATQDPPGPQGPPQPQEPPGQRRDRERREGWRGAMGVLSAVRVDEIAIRDGRVLYTDRERGIAAGLGDIAGSVHAIMPRPGDGDGGGGEPARYAFDMGTPGGGRLHVEGTVETQAQHPVADLRARLDEVDLPALNGIAKHADGLQFRSGVFSAFVEMGLRDGQVSGYLKPIFRDLDVKAFKDQKGNEAKRAFWKAVVGLAEGVLRNDEEDQHATRIPIKGTIEDPATDVWDVVGGALYNAFIQALFPGFEGRGGRDGD